MDERLQGKREADYTHHGVYPPSEGIGQQHNPRLQERPHGPVVGYSDGGPAVKQRGAPKWAWIMGLVLLWTIFFMSLYVTMFVMDLQEGLQKIGETFSDIQVPTPEPFPTD